MAISQIDQRGLAGYVIALSAEGLGCREISARLKQDHNFILSFAAVNNWLRGVRQERAETTQAVVQEVIKATVPRDLEILNEQIMQMDEWRKDDSLDVRERLQVIKEQRATIATKLDKCGASEQVKGPIEFIWGGVRRE